MSLSFRFDLAEYILTNSQGVIQTVNFKNNIFFEDKDLINKPIQDCFDNWEPLNNVLVSVTFNKRPLMLFSPAGLQFDESDRLFFCLDGDFWKAKCEQFVRLEKEIRDLDAIIETSFDGIYITDRNGVTLKTNSAIERITGIPKSYYIGKNIHQLIERGILKESVTVQIMDKKQPISVVQKNNQGKETLMTGSPIFDDTGEVDKIVTNIRDLSELNQLNEALNRTTVLKQKQNKLRPIKVGQLQADAPSLKNKKMVEITHLIEKLASFDPTILILGETGVGKDRLVRYIYETGLRSEKGQLIKVNCGAIPKALIESELFGYERGSFSGASRSGKPGLFELADHGILFLDEVGEMPLELQVRLLHAIQEKEIMRVGGIKPVKVDVQIIAATNKNLKSMVESGDFREDLYYRLNVVPIEIPPLRNRKEDLLPLVSYFLTSFCKKYAVHKTFDKSVLDLFLAYGWPGNIRELSNIIERLVLTVSDGEIKAAHLPVELTQASNGSKEKHLSLKEAVEEREKSVLMDALKDHQTTYDLAKALKTSQATIVRKLKKYQLKALHN